MKCLRQTLFILITFLVGIAWMIPANAVPAFASQTDKKCSYCHSAWPQLNYKGRQFKELGYRLPGDDPVELADYLQDLESFPISGIVVSRPYDKKEHGNTNLRALHEVEVILAGAFNKFSTFIEFEAEDEDVNARGFEVGVSNAELSYHHSKEVNIQLAWGGQFFTDPYGLLGDHFRLTRAHVGAIDQSFAGADAGGKLRSARQSIGLYGRLMDKLFYNVAWLGSAESKEGSDASNWQGRIAFDLTDDIMLGGFYVTGTDTLTSAVNRDFQRWGIDGQLDYKNLRLQALYIEAEGDNAVGIQEDNSAFTAQAFYTFRKKTGRPTFVPLVRYDTFERRDGSEEAESITFNLGYYITQNVKIYAEYFHELDDFGAKKEEDRFTIQLFVAF